MLHEVDFSVIERSLMGDRHLLVICAPNFEDRSLGMIERLLDARARLLQEEQNLVRITWMIVTFKGRDASSLLDGVKGHHARAGANLIFAEKNPGDAVRHVVLSYPLGENRLVSDLQAALAKLELVDQVIVDFSAIPRNILFKLIGAINRGSLRPHVSPESEITLTYCWAKNYPEVGALELVGEVRGQHTDLTLSDFAGLSDYTEVVLLAAGSVHDTYGALAGLEGVIASSEVSVNIIHLMRPGNWGESWRQLRNHHDLLRRQDRGWQTFYGYSVNHVMSMLELSALRVRRQAEHGRRAALCGAIFGPKPLAVGAQMIVDDLRARASGKQIPLNADIFNSHGTQYLSVYSLGAADVSVFQYTGVRETSEGFLSTSS